MFSKPTKAQVVKAVEFGVVSFVGTFVAVWLKQPDPFSRRALLAALGAAVGVVYGLVKAVTTVS